MPIIIGGVTILQTNVLEKIPQRVILSIFGLLAVINAYTMRLCLDIVMQQALTTQWTSTKLVRNVETTKKGINYKKQFSTFLSAFNSKRKPIKPLTSEVNWPKEIQALVKSSFHFGYVLSQIPGGLLAQKYGGKWVLGIGLLIAAILTILTPCAIKYGGIPALIVIRILIGLSEGPTYPALSALLAQWVPAKERGKLGVLVFSGGQVGIIIVNVVSKLLLRKFEWKLVFYFYGSCALLWFVCFIILCYNEPDSNPFICEQEKKYLKTELIHIKSKQQLSGPPWKEILTSPPVWALTTATIQYDMIQAHISSNTLKSLSDNGQESFYSNISSTTPYIVNWVISLTSGFISDILVNTNTLSITDVRKIMSLIAACGPKFFTDLISCISCSSSGGVTAFFSCAIGLMGTYYAGIKLTPLDMSPNYAATLMGIANSLGSINAIIAPFFEDFSAFYVKEIFERYGPLLLAASSMLISGDVQAFDKIINKLENKSN